MYFSTSQEIMSQYKFELENIKPRLKKVFEESLLNERVLSVKVNGMSKGHEGLAFFSLGSADGRRKGRMIIVFSDFFNKASFYTCSCKIDGLVD